MLFLAINHVIFWRYFLHIGGSLLKLGSKLWAWPNLKPDASSYEEN